MLERNPSGESIGEGMFSAAVGPGAIDSTIREAIRLCWMCAPPEQRNIKFVEEYIRKIVDRALRDWREDAAVFDSKEKA